jgi:hypothetical protein
MSERRPWSAEETAALAWLFHDGRTFARIAKALGRTRDSCLGKANRLNLIRDEEAVRERRSDQRAHELFMLFGPFQSTDQIARGEHA